MKTALTLLLLIIGHIAACAQMPIVDIRSASGWPDISVLTAWKRDNMPELSWTADTNIVPWVMPWRNAAKIPIQIRVPTNAPLFVGPSVADHPEWFTNFSTLPGLVMLKDFIRIAVLDSVDDVIREDLLTVPIIGLINNGRVELQPGRTYQVAMDMAFFDKTGMPNHRPDRINTEPPHWLFIQVDPLNRISGLNCNTLRLSRWYSGQVRHSESVDIP